MEADEPCPHCTTEEVQPATAIAVAVQVTAVAADGDAPAVETDAAIQVHEPAAPVEPLAPVEVEALQAASTDESRIETDAKDGHAVTSQAESTTEAATPASEIAVDGTRETSEPELSHALARVVSLLEIVKVQEQRLGDAEAALEEQLKVTSDAATHGPNRLCVAGSKGSPSRTAGGRAIAVAE